MSTSNRKSRGRTAAEYDAWAKYYDLTNEGLPGEAEFYVGQAVRLGGPVLELGCGTGRLAIPIAMSGVDVTGLDNSREMLRVCREKKREVGKTSGRLRVVRGDMRDFHLEAEFRFIFMAYRTFMHLRTPDDQRRALSAVHHHLDDDGVFILNCWLPKPSLLGPLADHATDKAHYAGYYELDGGKRRLVHFCGTRVDEMAQLLLEEHTFHLADRKGKVLGSETISMERAWTTPREMDNLVRLCGFIPEAVFGDFDCTPLTPKSSEQIWILRKP